MSDFHSTMSFKKEIIRKLIHASGALLLLLGEDKANLSILLLILFIFLYLMSQFLEKKTGKGIFILDQLTHSLKRETKKTDFAPPLLAFGIICSLYFFPFQIATCAILQICIGDAVAGIIGRRWGKKKVFYSSEKTYLGSFTFFLAAFLVQLPFLPPSHSAILALVGMFLESLSLGALDNFIVPLGVAMFLEWFRNR